MEQNRELCINGQQIPLIWITQQQCNQYKVCTTQQIGWRMNTQKLEYLEQLISKISLVNYFLKYSQLSNSSYY